MPNDIDLTALRLTWPELVNKYSAVRDICKQAELLPPDVKIKVPGDEIDTLVAHAVEVQKMLEKHQWVEDAEGSFYCPECEQGEHSPDCRLSRLIGGRK